MSYDLTFFSDMACEVLPAPNELSTEKIQNLLCSGVTSIEQLPSQTQDLKNGKSYHPMVSHPMVSLISQSEFFWSLEITVVESQDFVVLDNL